MRHTLFGMWSWPLLAGLLAGTSSGQAVFTRGQKFQIILSGTPDTSKMPLPPTDAPVWDVDLFNTDAAIIETLKAVGKIVICYFSAGTREDWRDDANQFPAGDVGKVLPEWPNEKWIRTGSAKIRDIMAKRIKIAADKGCDAIDPDNTGKCICYSAFARTGMEVIEGFRAFPLTSFRRRLCKISHISPTCSLAVWSDDRISN
jgi:hypothetical protein